MVLLSLFNMKPGVVFFPLKLVAAIYKASFGGDVCEIFCFSFVCVLGRRSV